MWGGSGRAGQVSTNGQAEARSSDVHRLEVDGREFILVGTAHVSRESVDLVREVIEQERPQCVCVELDAQRYEALSQARQWETLDLRQIIRRRQLTTLLINLLLVSYQRRLGLKLGVTPGSELLWVQATYLHGCIGRDPIERLLMYLPI